MSTLTTTTTHIIPLGVYTGDLNADTPAEVTTDDQSIATFDTLMGENAQFYDVFIDDTQTVPQWASNNAWAAGAWAATPGLQPMTPVIALPFASFAAGSQTADQMFQGFISGQYDSLITGAVQAWAKAGATTQYWRPGWEVNLLNAMPWGTNDTPQVEADYVAAFQHVYTVLHQAGTQYGVNVQVIWNLGTTNYGVANATTTLFPGANYVDVIGADVYQIDSPTASEIAGGDSLTLQNLINLAAATGKPLALPEVGNETNSPAFVQWLAQTLAQANVPIAFVNLWDSGSYAFTGPSATQPALAAAYAQYFGANAVNPLVGGVSGSVLNGTAGVAGATVTLLSSSGAVVATTTTSSTGAFSFASVTAGTYTVSYTAPSGLVLQNGSQASITTGQTAPITVTMGQTLSLPAELMLPNPGTIKSTVLHFGASTDPVGGTPEAGVTVSLLNASGSVIATTVSNSSGAFSFGNLAAGTYQVQYNAVAGQAIEPGTNATTAPITLAAGQTITAPSGSMITLATISGSVLLAGAGDGGVGITLWNSAGIAVTSTTSAANGSFSFSNVLPGSYTLQYVAPKGQYLQTGSQANVSTGVTASFTVAASQTASLPAETVLTNPAIIQFQAKHFDGPTDPSYGGVDAGVVVQLLNSAGQVIATGVSNSGSGWGEFTNLAAGTYQVDYLVPTGQALYANTSAVTAPITVAAGANVSATAGEFISLGTLTGSATAGGAAVAGMSVSLLSSSGATLASTTTGSTGAYSFANLAAGSYEVDFTAPQGLILQSGSEANAATGLTPMQTLAIGQTLTLPTETLLPAPATLGGAVMYQGVGDAGLTVSLIGSTGATVATTTTSSSGSFQFASIAAGSYAVQYSDNAATQLFGSGPANSTTGLTAAQTLTPGETLTLANETLLPAPAALSGAVTYAGAPDAGVAVTLIGATGATLATTTTNAAGNYAFSGLAAGSYEVQFPTSTATLFAAGPANSSTGLTGAFSLAAGQSVTLATEALVAAPASLSGAVTIANAADAGVTVSLLSSAGATLATTTTNSAGNFQFGSLAAGSYEVKYSDNPATQIFAAGPASAATGITAPVSLAAGQNLAIGTEDLEAAPATLAGSVSYAGAGDGGLAISLIGSSGAVISTTTTNSAGSFQFGGLAAGTYSVQYSDNAATQLYGSGPANSSTGLSAAVSLTAGQTLTLASETLLPAPASIAGSVIYQGAADGGIAVSLLNAAGSTIAATTTNAAGNFSFGGLSAGSYTVQYSGTASQLLGSGPASSATGLTSPVTLTPGQAMTLASETMLPAPATLSGSLTYLGAADSGVTVSLLNAAGTVQATAASDVNGNFAFGGLSAGSYEVQYSVPSGQLLASGPAGSNGVTAAQTLTPGETLNLAAENLQPAYATLSGSVQISKSGSSPSGAAGEDVSLLNSAGSVVATTVSQNNGYFQFSNLTAGSYSVQYASPSGAVAELGGAANPATGQTASISLAPGQNVALATQQLLSTPASITATVDFKGTGNWAQIGETVELLSSSGSVLATGVTNTSGVVSFGGLVSGSYALDYISPAGTSIVSGPSGINTSTGVTSAITVAAGAKVSEGVELITPAKSATLVGYTYSQNAAGVSSNLAGETVTLLDSAGDTLASVATSVWGGFQFYSLAAGTYQLLYSTPTGQTLQAGSAASGSTGLSSLITLTAGQLLTVAPETFVAANSVLSGSVQTSASGGAASGLAGVTVALLNAAGTVVASTTTGSTGGFQFSALAAGTYQVQYTAPAGQSLELGSLANPSSGLSSPISLGTGQTVALGAEQMLSLPGSISGVVQHAGSGDNGTGQSGVSVSLVNAAGTTIGTTTTNGSGSYSFANLAAGSYQVLYGTPSGEALMAGFGANPSTGLSSTVALAAGASLAMGVVELASTSNIFSLTGSGAAAVRGAGNYVVTGNASGSSLVLGAGNQSVALTGGNDTITTGPGNSTISALAGGNVINAGSGMNFITVDAASGNVFDLNNGAGGTTSISGFNPANDVLDLKATVSGLPMVNLSNLGSYVTATVSNGSTTLAVDPTPGAGTPVNFAILNGVNTTVANLITNNAISFS